MLDFASDNHAPVHPEVMDAVVAANDGSVPAYGGDPVTARLEARVRDVLGPGATVFPVLNGTGANVISLMAAAPRWGGVVLSDVAHANTDENGAPERVGGLKLLTRSSTDGRITVDDVAAWAGDRGNPHRAQPAVLSLTQSTELGTVYAPEDLKALVAAAHELGMLVHLDGSRLANAAAFLGTGLRELTTDAGVDLLSFGAAKNGGMIGEAVVVLDAVRPDGDAAADATAGTATLAPAHPLATGGPAGGLAAAVPYLRKQTMQLASKTRFVSAQLLALLGEPGSGADPLWLRNARHSNAMAARLRAGVEALPGGVVRVVHPTEANVVFASLPRQAAAVVREQARFHDWSAGETPDRVVARWMCSWHTSEADVDAFVAAVARAAETG
ncbi:threonine aldolase family protein [Myceligenerans crystallogenes]|uniref:Low specificity L-threonine aldolase n=1 Tax=Myceligenerans crystallogenes TaxID=316335 RepID=A0ABN2NDU0_9MICO